MRPLRGRCRRPRIAHTRRVEARRGGLLRADEIRVCTETRYGRSPRIHVPGRRLRGCPRRLRRQRYGAADRARDRIRHRRGRRRLGGVGHLPVEGRALCEATGRCAALEGARRSRPVDLAEDDDRLRPGVRAVRPDLRSGREQHLRRDDRHDAEPGGGRRGLPLPQHLAARQRPGGSAGDRVHPRRQQRLGLHRRPGLRRCRAREDRQRGRRHHQLPARHPRLPRPAAAAQRHRRAGGLRQLRAARRHQGVEVHQPQHCRVRRQPGQRDRDRAVRRRDRRLRASHIAGDGGGVAAAHAPGDADERRDLARLEPAGGQPADPQHGGGRTRPRQCAAAAAGDRRRSRGRHAFGAGLHRHPDERAGRRPTCARRARRRCSRSCSPSSRCSGFPAPGRSPKAWCCRSIR